MNNQTVLIVDDNPQNVDLFKAALRSIGHACEVAIAHDGQEALDWLFSDKDHAERDTSVTPCLILLDLNMPGMNGLPCLRRLRADQRTELLPVVIFTNSDLAQDRIDAYRAGANGYVDKMSLDLPFPEMVKRITDYWLEVNHPPPIEQR
jgi:two-component system, response regulator